MHKIASSAKSWGKGDQGLSGKFRSECKFFFTCSLRPMLHFLRSSETGRYVYLGFAPKFRKFRETFRSVSV